MKKKLSFKGINPSDTRKTNSKKTAVPFLGTAVFLVLDFNLSLVVNL